MVDENLRFARYLSVGGLATLPSDSVAAIASNAAWLMAILIIGQTAERSVTWAVAGLSPASTGHRGQAYGRTRASRGQQTPA